MTMTTRPAPHLTNIKADSLYSGNMKPNIIKTTVQNAFDNATAPIKTIEDNAYKKATDLIKKNSIGSDAGTQKKAITEYAQFLMAKQGIKTPTAPSSVVTKTTSTPEFSSILTHATPQQQAFLKDVHQKMQKSSSVPHITAHAHRTQSSSNLGSSSSSNSLR